MNAIAPGSLTALRLPSALMSGGTVLVTRLIAHELGSRRRAQLIAASRAAAASVVLVVGHLLSTTTFDLLALSLVSWLVVRALGRGEQRLWPAAGIVAGLALLNKPLIAFLLAALTLGLLVAGPRRALRSGWTWAAPQARRCARSTSRRSVRLRPLSIRLERVSLWQSRLLRVTPCCHGVFSGPDDLAAQMLAFVEHYNLTAQPFACTYTGKVLTT